MGPRARFPKEQFNKRRSVFIWYVAYYPSVRDAEPILQPASRVQCNIAFGDMVKYSPLSYVKESIETLFPTLLEVLNDIPHVDFDPSLSWRGEFLAFCIVAITDLVTSDWALPDQLVYSIVSALLQVCNRLPAYRERAVDAICSYLSRTVEEIDTFSCKYLSLSLLLRLT
jgi:phosphatidylinositol 4-kinase